MKTRFIFYCRGDMYYSEGKSRRILTPTQLFAASAAQPKSSFEGIRAALDWSAGPKIVDF